MYVFHPYSCRYSFSTDGQLRKRNFAIYCSFKQWYTKFPNILGANLNFLAPEGRDEAPTNSSRPRCTKCIHPGDPLPGDLCIPALWEFRVQILTQISAVLNEGFSQSSSKRCQELYHKSYHNCYILRTSKFVIPQLFSHSILYSLGGLGWRSD